MDRAQWVTARRAISILAPASLLFAQGRAENAADFGSVWRSVLVAGGYALLLLLVIAAATARSERRLAQIDVATLVSAVIITGTEFLGVTSRVIGAKSDEQVLNVLAQRLFDSGHDPYGHVFRLVGADGYGTPLLDGGNARTYGYPPLALELGRLGHLVWPRLGAPGVVELAALVLLAVGCFVMTPVAWRGLSIVAVLGIPIIAGAALSGLSIVLGAALLAPALYRWSATGRSAELGRGGVARAVCLGLACAAHQLIWFAAVFLVLGLLLIRVGELGWSRAAQVMLRYVAIAVATFLVVDAPFLLLDPRAWADGMLVTFTQHAIVDGGSWALPLIEAHGGTGALDVLRFAAPLSLLATLLVFTFGVRRLAPAIMVLPSLVFLLSARSNDQYFWALLPVWLLAATGAEALDVRRAWGPARRSLLARLFGTRPRRIAAALALWSPAVAVFCVGVTGTPPVSVRAEAATVRSGQIVTLTVLVHNAGAAPVRPQYYIDGRSAATHPWLPPSALATLPAHSTTRVVLHPISALEPHAAAANLWIFATVARPDGMSTRPIRLSPSRIRVLDLPSGNRLSDLGARCAALRLTGRDYDCTTQLGLTTAG